MNNIVLKNVRPFVNGKFSPSTTMYLKEGFWVSEAPENATEIDGKNALVLPALFGLGLDFKEPHRDDIYTFKKGIKAMHRGGFFGGLYESSANAIDDLQKLLAMKALGEQSGLKFAFTGAFSVNYECKDLTEMIELSEAGVAGFGDGGKNTSKTRFLRLALEYGAMTGKRFFFLPLDESLKSHGLVHEGNAADTLGMKGIPEVAETIAAFKILEVARFLNVPVHLKQVSAKATLKIIENARAQGVDVTCDVDIYHLLFDDSTLFELNSLYHVAMPFRSAEDKEALWQGLENGTINAISVNHDPVLRQEKEVNFEDSVPGAISLEVALPALWKQLSTRLGDARALELLSTAPAKIAGIKAPELQLGAEAHCVLLSEDEFTVTANHFAGQVENSPLLGKTLSSKILASYIASEWTEIL